MVRRKSGTWILLLFKKGPEEVGNSNGSVIKTGDWT